MTEPDRGALLDRYGYEPEVRRTIEREDRLPGGLPGRLHAPYASRSSPGRTGPLHDPALVLRARQREIQSQLGDAAREAERTGGEVPWSSRICSGKPVA